MIEYMLADLRKQVPATAFFGIYAWHHWGMVKLEDFTCPCGYWHIVIPPVTMPCIPTGIERDRGFLYWVHYDFVCPRCGQAVNTHYLYLQARTWVHPYYAKSLEGGRG